MIWKYRPPSTLPSPTSRGFQEGQGLTAHLSSSLHAPPSLTHDTYVRTVSPELAAKELTNPAHYSSVTKGTAVNVSTAAGKTEAQEPRQWEIQVPWEWKPLACRARRDWWRDHRGLFARLRQRKGNDEQTCSDAHSQTSSNPSVGHMTCARN